MAKLSLNAVLAGITPADKTWEAKAKARVKALAVPPWSLGRLSEIGVRLCGMQRTLSPDVSKKLVITCGADEGVADEGVSAFPQDTLICCVVISPPVSVVAGNQLGWMKRTIRP